MKKTIAINNSSTGVKCLMKLVNLHFLIDLQKVFVLTLPSLEGYILLLAHIQLISLKKPPTTTNR